jgi:hypothetical protein
LHSTQRDFHEFHEQAPAKSALFRQARQQEFFGKPVVSESPVSSLLKKASERAIASAARNSSSLKANKKRDSMSPRTSK